MPAPLTLAQFKLKTIMPDEDVDYLESKFPNFLTESIADHWDEIKGRLRKRYDVAKMEVDPPRIVRRWLTALVTREAYGKRGNNPSATSDEKDIYGAAERAEVQLKEAADSKEGLYDLPLLASSNESGVTRGGPLGYSETSPYLWTEHQKNNAED